MINNGCPFLPTDFFYRSYVDRCHLQSLHMSITEGATYPLNVILIVCFRFGLAPSPAQNSSTSPPLNGPRNFSNGPISFDKPSVKAVLSSPTPPPQQTPLSPFSQLLSSSNTGQVSPSVNNDSNTGSNQHFVLPPRPQSSLSRSSSCTMTNPNNHAPPPPQRLEQLLERQWEQGSQFLMEQSEHFDIASLLSCLNQLRSENQRLESHVSSLLARRDHLLAVNARLSVPLSQPNSPPELRPQRINNYIPSDAALVSFVIQSSSRLYIIIAVALALLRRDSLDKIYQM